MSEAAFPVVPARAPASAPRLRDGRARGGALGHQRRRLEGDPRVRAVVGAARAAALARRGGAGCSLILAVAAPGRLRLTRRELPYLVIFGVAGLAFVQWFYFLAIHRLAIGVALLIEYLAPLLVALWARFVQHAPVRRRIWVALALALAGLALIVQLFGGGATLSTAGILFALGGAVRVRDVRAARRARRRRSRPVSILGWGFLFASVFWAVHQPVVEVPRPRDHRATRRSAATSRRGTCRSGRSPPG